MKTEQFKAEDLANLLRKRTIATMDELKAALGTDVYLTVLRKLQKLGYISSYSHRGQYYSLEESAEFDDNGLWRFGPALQDCNIDRLFSRVTARCSLPPKPLSRNPMRGITPASWKAYSR